MKRLIFLLLILLVPLIIADCDDGQININSASTEELEEIIWVGPATAEKIIAGREFDSVDSLIDVSGIGDIKLQAIKEQGLACVENEEAAPEEESESESSNEDSRESEEKIIIPSPTLKEKVILEPEIIRLGYESQKDIKTEKNNSNKNKYAIYGLVFFCVLIVFLLILKKNRFNKNEFS